MRRSSPSGSPVTRRGVLAGALAAAAASRRVRAGGRTPCVVALDYALAETLLAIGAPLAAMSGADQWSTWVVEPPLPPAVRDIGSAQLSNFELLARLKPDLILTTPFLDPVSAPLTRLGPVLRVPIYEEGRRPFDAALAATRLLGDHLGRREAADAFLAGADREFRDLAARVRTRGAPPLALANMFEARHVRIHGGAGLLQAVLDRLGIRNAYEGETNYWGFQTIGIERLASMGEARLVLFEPVPPDATATLNASPLWRELPFVREGRVSTLPPVNAFGAVPSALRLARLLVSMLEGDGRL